MKYDRFTTDYERVRRQASLGQAEFYDPDEPPDPGVAARVQDRAAETMAELSKQHAEAQSEQRRLSEADMDAVRKRTNDRMRLAAWEQYGIKPPSPTASLELYLSMGWTLEHTGIGWKLMRPDNIPAPPDEDQNT